MEKSKEGERKKINSLYKDFSDGPLNSSRVSSHDRLSKNLPDALKAAELTPCLQPPAMMIGRGAETGLWFAGVVCVPASAP